MTADRKKTIQPDRPKNEKKPVGPQAQADDDDCRCKSTALMSPRQLLRLMADDLSFWKKPKKG